MNEEIEQNTHRKQISEIENRLRRFSNSDLNAILAIVKALSEKY